MINRALTVSRERWLKRKTVLFTRKREKKALQAWEISYDEYSRLRKARIKSHSHSATDFCAASQRQYFHKKLNSNFSKRTLLLYKSRSFFSRLMQIDAHSPSMAPDCSCLTELVACKHLLILQMTTPNFQTLALHLFST